MPMPRLFDRLSPAYRIDVPHLLALFPLLGVSGLGVNARIRKGASANI
jgi:hypothetical protein